MFIVILFLNNFHCFIIFSYNLLVSPLFFIMFYHVHSFSFALIICHHHFRVFIISHNFHTMFPPFSSVLYHVQHPSCGHGFTHRFCYVHDVSKSSSLFYLLWLVIFYYLYHVLAFSFIFMFFIIPLEPLHVFSIPLNPYSSSLGIYTMQVLDISPHIYEVESSGRGHVCG